MALAETMNEISEMIDIMCAGGSEKPASELKWWCGCDARPGAPARLAQAQGKDAGLVTECVQGAAHGSAQLCDVQYTHQMSNHPRRVGQDLN